MNLNRLWFLMWVFLAASVSAEQRLAFVTSVSGDGDLSSWPDAGSDTGLAAADAICQARAATAGLSNPTNFVALLSDSVDDAYCRLTGHSGKKVDSCGLATLPTEAGPWINTLGENFAENLTLMLAPNFQVYRALNHDEFGELAPEKYFTGSLFGAEYDPTIHVCDDWTNANVGQQLTILGDSRSSGSGVLSGFFYGSERSCSSISSLACFETVVGDPLIPEEPLGSLAFVTDDFGTGDLSTWPKANGATGVEAADEICRTSALNAGLDQPDEFIAWISDDNIDAIDRFQYHGPWYRQDGVVVAHDLDELTSGRLNAPNNLNEDMKYINNIAVWTGTDAHGLAVADHCNSWQSEKSFVGASGVAQSTEIFSNEFGSKCDFFSRLYCFHNVALDLIFKDSFDAIVGPD